MLTRARIGGVLILAFCLTYAWLIADIRLLPFQRGQAFTARTMPQVLAALGVVLSLVVILQPGGERPAWRGLRWGRVALFLGLMSLYGLGVRPLGFLIATSAFLMVGFALLGERRVWMLAAVALPLVVAFWVLMTQGLEVWIDPWPSL